MSTCSRCLAFGLICILCNYNFATASHVSTPYPVRVVAHPQEPVRWGLADGPHPPTHPQPWMGGPSQSLEGVHPRLGGWESGGFFGRLASEVDKCLLLADLWETECFAYHVYLLVYYYCIVYFVFSVVQNMKT